MVMLLCVLLIVLGLLLQQGKSWDGGGSYLYDGDIFNPVIDYKPPTRLANENRFTYDNRLNHPDFLSYNRSNSRIVVFYSPWCPHCQHYVDTYVKVAREITATNQNILFYAVSCTVHHVICSQQEVQSYPTIKYFPREHADGIVLHHRNSANDILNEIESTVGKTPIQIQNTEVYANRVRQDIDISIHNSTGKRNNLLASRISTVVEDRSLLQSDAATSFRFAMRYSILSISNQRMSQQSGLALRSWLDLLNKTLPKNEEMGSTLNLIHNLLDHFDTVSAGDSQFISNIFATVGETFQWTSSCTHDSNITGAGYTCGLWHLFHIATIGLVDWNQRAPIVERISTIDAAITLRNYIEYFFACDECRSNFLAMYDSCGFEHCHLFTGSISINDDWEQLSLWLHEVHNDVRVRTLSESLSRQGLTPPTMDEIQSIKWPPRDKCPQCWKDDVSSSLSPAVSNKLETFQFMWKTLWADDSSFIEEKHSESLSESSSIFFLLSMIMFMIVIIFQSKKRLLHLKAV